MCDCGCGNTADAPEAAETAAGDAWIAPDTSTWLDDVTGDVTAQPGWVAPDTSTWVGDVTGDVTAQPGWVAPDLSGWLDPVVGDPPADPLLMGAIETLPPGPNLDMVTGVVLQPGLDAQIWAAPAAAEDDTETAPGD
jgi:hypothetical protein